jgi:PAS domain-containing protein
MGVVRHRAALRVRCSFAQRLAERPDSVDCRDSWPLTRIHHRPQPSLRSHRRRSPPAADSSPSLRDWRRLGARRRADRYRRFLDALGVAVYTTDRDGSITFFNAAAAAFWGRRPELGESWCGSLRLRWPDGRPMRHDECPMAITLKEARPVRGGQAIAERPDGSNVSFMAYPTPRNLNVWYAFDPAAPKP